MKGKNVLRHKDITEINEQLTAGVTPEAISNWLKQKYKADKMMLVSAVTLTAYRNNFIQMTKEQLAEKKRELVANRNTGDVNAIDTFTAVKEFTEAKGELTTELVNVVNNFKTIQDEIKERMAVFKTKTVDDDGNPIWNVRNEEVFLGYLARLESMTNSFVKTANDIKKQELKSGNTDIQITVHEMNKYADAFKNILQRILIQLDPSMVPEALTIYAEEISKIEGMDTSQNQLNISINNASGPNISIMTSQQQPVKTEQIPDKINIIDIDTKEIN